MALGGMQDVGQNGPENELNPLIDNGFMYTSDGWGTIYKIDARNPGRGKFVWVADPGVQHEGNTSRTRGIALWEDKVLANLPDGRVIAINRDNGEIVWDKKIAAKNEFGNQERFLTAPLVADGKVLVQNGAGDAGTRGWVAALDVNSGNELWRWYTCRSPASRQRDLEGRSQRLEDRRRRHLADRLLRRGAEPLHLRHRQSRPRSTTRSSGPATTSTPTRSSRSTWPPARWRGTSSTRRTTRGTTTRPACSCSTTRRSAGGRARWSATTRATGSSTRWTGPTDGSSRPRST